VNQLVQPGVSLAFANHSQWKAFCGHRHACDGAAALQRFQPGFICQSCGRATDVIWPAAEMVQGVERLLMMRPNPKNRNWLPGEDLVDLMNENADHGVLLPYISDDTEGRLLSVASDKILTDALPLAQRRELVR
jgi:hypothetical protein